MGNRTKRKTFEQIVKEEELKMRKPANYTYYKTNVLEDDKAIIVPFSDWHWGNQYCKEKELEKNLEWAYDTRNAYLLLNGDLVEAKTRNRAGDGVFTQKNPQGQIESVLNRLKPFSKENRIIAMTNGNHEDAITLETGVDITALMANELNVPYLKNGGFVGIKTGEQLYNLYVTHGSSGATLPYTKIKAARDIGTFVEGVDAIVYGHVHDKQDHTQEIYFVDNRSRSIKTKTVHYILSGHYLDYLQSYAQQKSMRPSATGTPKIKLHGKEHLLRVSL